MSREGRGDCLVRDRSWVRRVEGWFEGACGLLWIVESVAWLVLSGKEDGVVMMLLTRIGGADLAKALSKQ